MTEQETSPSGSCQEFRHDACEGCGCTCHACTATAFIGAQWLVCCLDRGHDGPHEQIVMTGETVREWSDSDCCAQVAKTGVCYCQEDDRG